MCQRQFFCFLGKSHVNIIFYIYEIASNSKHKAQDRNATNNKSGKY